MQYITVYYSILQYITVYYSIYLYTYTISYRYHIEHLQIAHEPYWIPTYMAKPYWLELQLER